MPANDAVETQVAENTAESILSRAKSKSLMGVQIEITVSVGQARIALSDLVALEKESVLQLDSHIEDPVDIFIGDRLVARGELEEIDGDQDRLGVRLTEVADMPDWT